MISATNQVCMSVWAAITQRILEMELLNLLAACLTLRLCSLWVIRNFCHAPKRPSKSGEKKHRTIFGLLAWLSVAAYGRQQCKSCLLTSLKCQVKWDFIGQAKPIPASQSHPEKHPSKGITRQPANKQTKQWNQTTAEAAAEAAWSKWEWGRLETVDWTVAKWNESEAGARDREREREWVRDNGQLHCHCILIASVPPARGSSRQPPPLPALCVCPG